MNRGFTFDANDHTLSEIFFDTKRTYRIPRYQRPYAWTLDQVTDFWEDLFQANEPYFFGSFIFNTENEKEFGYVDIIDGQQRLLTMTIMMSVIRDIAKNIDKPYSDLVQRQDISIEDWEGKSAYRIRPAESLQEYFNKYIQTSNGIIDSKTHTAEELRVKTNYQYLLEKISIEVDRAPSKTGKIEILRTIRKKLRDLMVIEIEISREEDAYDIFETTNARGMELSVSDLLKNLVFKNVKPGPDKDFAKEVWNEITTNIEDTNTELKRFIRYFWISKYNFVQEKRLYKEIKLNIAESEMQNFLQDLWDDSAIYNLILEGDESDFQNYGDNYRKIYRSIFAIRLMGVTQCLVLLMTILRNYQRLGFDPYKTIQIIEKFSFIYSSVCKQPGNRVEKIYSKYALEIEETAKDGPNEKVRGKLNSIFDHLKNELFALVPSETIFIEYFMDISYKNSTESRVLIKYILEKFNSYFKKNDEYMINFEAVNIEHLLPQNPDSEWHLSKTQIKNYVNKLGNLTLLSKKINSKVQNSIIAKKLPKLKESELEITKRIVILLESLKCQWGEDQINDRQKEFAQISYREIWKF